MDLYYDILLAATPEGCPEPPRSDFYNEMVDQLCRKALRDIRTVSYTHLTLPTKA